MRPTGARIVDHVLGGYPPSLPLVIAGANGCGRTVLSLQLAHGALARGERVELVSSEPSASLIHQAGALGFAFEAALRDERLVLLELDAAAAPRVRAQGVDALAEALHAEAPEAAVVIVDPFTAITAEIVDEPKLREVARTFARLLPARHLVLTVEAERLSVQRGLDRVLLELCGAYLVLEREASGRRMLTVEKTRSGTGSAEKVEFAIGPGGTHLVEDADLVPARPAVPPPAPATVAVAAPAAPPRLDEAQPRRPLVLVVEDSRLQRELLREWLAERCEVIAASDGFEAMAALLAHKPDLVILDLIMPRVTGYELLCALRRASLDVPVLVASSKVSSAGDRLGPLVLGATDFLAKPVNRLELEHKVDTLLRLRRENDRRFDPGEAEALFGKVTSSRLLDSIEFNDRLARACSFGERHGLPSSLALVGAPNTRSLDRWIEVANGELRFEDAILRIAKRRALVLLVATPPADAPKVTDRLIALADEAAGRALGISVEIQAADASQAEPARLEALADDRGPEEAER